MMRVLLLGGTGEGRKLAEALVDRPDWYVVTSLAGRLALPTPPPGELRVGGFGGPEGLAAWLRAEGIGAVVDATHPFAARISASALTAAASVGVPLIRLSRAGWTEQEGDRWVRVGSLAEAAKTLSGYGDRVFLTTGRQSLASFAYLTEPWFLARCVDPPEGLLPPKLTVLLDRGPFTVDGEVALLDSYQIRVLVSKDSGGEMTAAKLTAARRLAVPVILVDRPAASGAPTVSTVEDALSWLDSQA
jgi:precorrin-6A/cobalt-precorrin-6A reductase